MTARATPAAQQGPTHEPAQEVEIGGFRLALRELEPGDRDAVLRLHAHVFGSGVTPAWYGWKYGAQANAGLGAGVAVGVWHGEELIAHCAGLPRRLLHAGEPRRGLQIGDVMVHPQWRGLLTRRGPFFQACHRLYSRQLGAGRPHQIGFGFPNERHLRLAVMLKLSWHGGPIHQLRWPAQGAPALPWSWRWTPLAPAPASWQPALDTAWRSMREAAGEWMLGERNAAYIRWRYLERPDKSYRLYRLHRAWPGGSGGIAVLGFEGGEAQWLDWIGPPALMPLAAAACRAEAARQKTAALSGWFSPLAVQQLEATQPAARDIVAWLGIPSDSILSEQEVADTRFWFMGGDTDFL